MKSAMVLLAVICLAFAAEMKKEAKSGKTLQRLIPADVLRDFPDHCFASTKCSTFEVGQQWDLAPFCGRSTCIQAEGDGQLLEMVEDCGPFPKENPKCKLSEKTNKAANFPDCCPIFDCEPGVTLEYPEIPTPEKNNNDKKL